MAGISSKDYGTVTIGRQTTTLSDVVTAYSPTGGSAYAFSLIDFSGTTKGAGVSEYSSMDNSLKYSLDQFGSIPLRFGLTYQQTGVGGATGPSEEARLGGDYAGLSVDAVYSHIKGAVVVTTLGTTAASAGKNTLSATVSDNTGYTLAAKYAVGSAVIEGGFEHAYYTNPTHPLAAGTAGNGGYVFSVINNTA
jgi:predicted porin